MNNRILWSGLGLLTLGVGGTKSAEQQFHCAHCAAMAAHAAAAAQDGSGAPLRRYAPDRVVDVRHLKLEITPDFDTQTLDGVAILDFKPIAKPLRQWTLSARDLRVLELESSHEVEAHQVTEDGLEITFVESIPAGEDGQVRVVYEAEPKDGLYFRSAAMGYPAGDEQLWTQGEPEDHQHWFPSHDYPNEKFTTELICHVPKGMMALSNGRLVSESTNEETGLTAFHWLQDKVHVNYLVTLVAGYFEKIEDKYGELPIGIYVPPSKIDVAHNTFRDTKKILAYFEEEIGYAYPWDKYYNVCAIDYMMGGMENTSLTTLTTRTLFPDSMENLRSSRSLDAHEVAHQWFGDLVTCRDWSHLWLNEGFATYYSLLYDRHLLGDDFFKLGLHKNAKGIFRNDKDIIPIVHRGYDDPMEQFSFRAYPKGGWVLHMLRTELGEELFRKCVKTYLERHAYKTVVTQDLVEIFEELSGRSLSQFFDQWVYLSGYPSLDIKYAWDALAKQAKITVSQTQMMNEKRALFSFPLPVRFKLGDVDVERVIEVSQQREDFYFGLSSAPEVVRFDPEVTVLAKIDFKPPEKMLLAQLENAEDAMGRLLAVEQLANKKNGQTVEKLAALLEGDPFFAVREAAAEGLGSMRREDAFDALREGLDQDDARVRRAVVSAIGRSYSDEAYNLVKRVADQENNPLIRGSAIRGLGNYAKPELRPYLVGLLESDSYEHGVAQAAISAMRAQDDAFYVDPLLRSLRESESKFTSSGFGSALRALGHLARHEESKDGVRQFLLEHTDHLKRSVARSAMGALGELGDPKARPLLSSFVAIDADSADGKAAKRALDQIGKEVPPAVPAEVSRLRGEVRDLQSQLKQMNEAIKTLRERFHESLKEPEEETTEAAEN